MNPTGAFLLLLSMIRSVTAVLVETRGTILTQICFFFIDFSPKNSKSDA